MMVMMMMMMMITSVCADAQDHAGPHGEGPCAEDLWQSVAYFGSDLTYIQYLTREGH